LVKDTDRLYRAGLCSSGRDRSSEGPEDPSRDEKVSARDLFTAGVQGMLAAIAYDAGIALAGGPALTELETKADIFSGFLGGLITPLLAPLIGPTASFIISSGTIGYLYQVYISQAGTPRDRSQRTGLLNSSNRMFPLAPYVARKEKTISVANSRFTSLRCRRGSSGGKHQNHRGF